MTTKVLITGIAGFIGSHVVDFFSKRKYDVFGIDNFSTGKHENLVEHQNKIQEIFEGTITDPSFCIAAVMKYKPDIIIHLAAQPSLLTSQKQPEVDAAVNVVGTINMLKAAVYFGVDRFVFSSTSAITDNPVITETDAWKLVIPTNPYGMSKRTAESYIRLLMPKKSVILRYANVYGPRQVPLGENQLVPRVMQHILYGDEFEVYGDGLQTRDYIYVRDVAEVTYLAATKGIIRNQMCIGTGKNHSTIEVVEEVFNAMDMPAVYSHGKDRDGRQHVRMIVEYARISYGWRAKTSLREGIEKTAKWWQHEFDKSTHSR